MELELSRWHRNTENPLAQQPEDLASGLTPIPKSGQESNRILYPTSNLQPPLSLLKR